MKENRLDAKNLLNEKDEIIIAIHETIISRIYDFGELVILYFLV